MSDSDKRQTVTGGDDGDNSVVTLCGVSGCCPTVDFSDPNTVVITDDNGGKVTLTRAELAELVTAAQNR